MHRFDFLNGMSARPLSKNINRQPEARCFYRECDGKLEFAPRNFQVTLANYKFGFDILTPQCVKCEQFIISDEAQYAELLAARRVLLEPVYITGAVALAVRRIIGGTQKDLVKALDRSVEEISRFESMPVVPDCYGYTLLGIITQEISIMES